MFTPSGKRDRKIELQRSVTVTSDLGVEKPGGWERICSPMALVRYGTSQERRDAASEGASQVATFRVMATAKTRSVTEAGCRILSGARGDGSTQAWNITGIAPIGREEIEFTAIAAKG